ncbi:alpha/beta hydrolase [Inquilinus sp. CAU 1745]|uniref:alpha/beta hydrolase n=1 Tax=Inquilinus sp. CAU 1745 TaxID=3140369 RepID=UPI00325A7F88
MMIGQGKNRKQAAGAGASRRVLIRLAAIIFTGYAVIVALFYGAQGYLLHPGRLLPANPDVVTTLKPLTILSGDGVRLTAWYGPPSMAGKPTVLMLHGNNECAWHRAFDASDLTVQGYGVLALEYRGYCGAPGWPTEANMIADAATALAFLEDRGARVVAYGYSIGSGVAVGLAAGEGNGKLAGLFLEAPFTSAVDAAVHLLPFLPVRVFMRDRFNSLDRIDEVEAPIVVCHGTDDAIIPAWQFDTLFQAAPEPRLRVVAEGADHISTWRLGCGEAFKALVERATVDQVDA